MGKSNELSKRMRFKKGNQEQNGKVLIYFSTRSFTNRFLSTVTESEMSFIEPSVIITVHKQIFYLKMEINQQYYVF